MLPGLHLGRLPVLVGEPHEGRNPRSPYRCTPRVFAEVFGTDAARVDLLNRFFSLRARLRSHLQDDSWQWVSGSFLELKRQPKDLDVVVWVSRRDAATLDAYPEFERAQLKLQEHLDVFFVPTDFGGPRWLQSQSAYWYELWTSVRGGGRKGFVELDSSGTDHEALQLLRSRAR